MAWQVQEGKHPLLDVDCRVARHKGATVKFTVKLSAPGLELLGTVLCYQAA
jgi:hypothetical protein